MPDVNRKATLSALIAVATLGLLSTGILIGHFLMGHEARVLAGTHDIPTELATAFVQIARRVEPSVVNITTVTQPQRSERNSGVDPQTPYDLGRQADREVRRGNGSGVIVDVAGFILTNHHVIVGADRIKVKLADGSEYPGRVVGSDQEADLAVLKIEPRETLPSAKLGDSEKSQVGDWVLAIGSPFGLDQTVTAGIISAKDREANELRNRPSFQHFLQTDAAINRGNSGGPLINLAGEVIGINSAIATTTGDYNGIGFALPSDEAIEIYRQLTRTGRVTRGFLGIVTDPVTPQIAKVYGLPSTRGAIVSIVTDTYRNGSRETATPAARAGIRLGDIVLQYRDEPVRSSQDLIRRVASTPVGTDVAIKVLRNGLEVALTTTIGTRPSADPGRETLAASVVPDDDARGLGLDVANMPPGAGRDVELSGISGVVVVKVDPGSLSEDAELRRDDIIEQFNRAPVANSTQFRRALERLRAGEPIVFQVYRRKSAVPRRFVSLTKP
jgi:serine protease Do